jgi:hypothetical protein
MGLVSVHKVTLELETYLSSSRVFAPFAGPIGTLGKLVLYFLFFPTLIHPLMRMGRAAVFKSGPLLRTVLG